METLHTSISIDPPKGTYVRIAPCSGFSHKHQLHVLAGIIDTDYREEFKVLLQKLAYQPIIIIKYQRIT